jgi:hypothetical protein
MTLPVRKLTLLSFAAQTRGEMSTSSEQPIQVPVTGSEPAPPTMPIGALAEFYRAFNGRILALMERNWDPSPAAVWSDVAW